MLLPAPSKSGGSVPALEARRGSSCPCITARARIASCARVRLAVLVRGTPRVIGLASRAAPPGPQHRVPDAFARGSGCESPTEIRGATRCSGRRPLLGAACARRIAAAVCGGGRPATQTHRTPNQEFQKNAQNLPGSICRAAARRHPAHIRRTRRPSRDHSGHLFRSQRWAPHSPSCARCDGDHAALRSKARASVSRLLRVAS